MPQILRALPWAAASVLVAVASIFELIPESSAQTLIVVIPVLMVATMNAKPCALRQQSV
ncbi:MULTISPECIES: hypothetical protein [unclassified Sphingopyxis]|jgi:hypothetical protein|uniref:hypothetical protein n=1 Tax=unclassified Sphingopyxis TaxID=2614943 RepID=UPI0028584A87|nr:MULTISPECIES: hypothetical protein [unclassified Sphingopyxis]MDR6834636.1 hypothetical protein [Sphingopyxis sp. BE122]MDR7226906.1 hypothetical protein [Sphingopyxis sp. BE259]